jgi:ethanolamine utilization protein EutN
MQLGRVVGQVVATVKDPSLEGHRLLIVQGLDERLREVGKPFVAVDAARCAGPGDVVYLCFKRDAAVALGDKPPVDAAILGYVDEVAVEDGPGGPVRIVERKAARKAE